MMGYKLFKAAVKQTDSVYYRPSKNKLHIVKKILITDNNQLHANTFLDKQTYFEIQSKCVNTVYMKSSGTNKR